MPNSVSGLNLYDADKFRAFGEQVLKDSKDIIDGKKAQGTPEVQDVPVVPENNDDQNNGLDITSFSRNKSADNSAASNIYDDVQGMRASLEGGQQSSASNADEVSDLATYLSDEENGEINHKMMNIHGSYKKQYGNKYFHGSVTSDNCFEHEFEDRVTGISTNTNANLVYGTNNSATLLNASFQYGRTYIPEQDISEDVNSSTQDMTDDDVSATNATRRAVTRAGEEEYSDPEIPATPRKTEPSIINQKDVDIAILHNRQIDIDSQKFVVGAGAEWHSHNNGDDKQLTFRGGFGHVDSGFGVTVSTTSYESVDENNERHTARDSKVKVVLLNNEIDEYPVDLSDSDDTENNVDAKDLPIVKTKNKLGTDFIADNGRLGFDSSYVIHDNASLKNGVYNRSQLYLKAGYLNETQGEDTPDRHKIKLGATWKYQHAESKDFYFGADASVAYYNNLQSGSSPEYLLGFKGNINANIKAHQISFTGAKVQTNNLRFSELGLNYRYVKNKFEFGANVGYSNVYMSDNANTKYLDASVNVAYKF